MRRRVGPTPTCATRGPARAIRPTERRAPPVRSNVMGPAPPRPAEGPPRGAMTVTVRPETASAPPRPAAEESPSPPGPRWRGWLAAYWIPAIALAGLALHFLLRLAPGWQNWPLLAVILAAGLVLAAMTLGAMLASSALADGGSSPITFNLGAVTLNRQRAVVI